MCFISGLFLFGFWCVCFFGFAFAFFFFRFLVGFRSCIFIFCYFVLFLLLVVFARAFLLSALFLFSLVRSFFIFYFICFRSCIFFCFVLQRRSESKKIILMA